MRESPLVLLTGVNGFTGQHMARFLLSRNLTVVGVGRSSKPAMADKRLLYEPCDLRSPSQVWQLLDRYPFQFVIHLAGMNRVPHAALEPNAIFEENTVSTLYLLEAIYQKKFPSLQRMLIVGSAQEYGSAVEYANMPFTEQSPARPTNPYGRSKRIQTALADLYAHCYDLPIVITRTFNLVGPGATYGVCAQIARQIVAIERGLLPPQLQIGTLQTQRDFLDVRDAVSAYWALLQHDKPLPPGELYNVCSGISHSIADMVRLFRQQAHRDFEVHSAADLYRDGDPLFLAGDNRKLRALTGWQPIRTLAASIVDLLDEFRNKEAPE